MTRIIIDNVKDEFIPAFREFAEKMEANISDIHTKGAESSLESSFESSATREEPYICDYGYSHEPNDETIRALKECERGEGEIVENFSAIEFHKRMLAELKSENGA